ncbi:MAG: Porphobilinogen synthase, partial [Phycisphaerales bacterium]|nr:Porphobilinogen synthase [Phycisphaerales bacterium]
MGASPMRRRNSGLNTGGAPVPQASVNPLQNARIIADMSDSFDLPIRPRRLRQQLQLRRMLPRVSLRRSDFIVPVFVREGSGVRQEVPSMPGVYQMSIDVALD